MSKTHALLERVIAAVRAMTPATLDNDRDQIVAVLERLLPQPPVWALPMSEREKRAAIQRHALRRVAWLRENNLSEKTAPMFRRGVMPSGLAWAEQVALLVQDRPRVTTTEVLTLLGTNRREHADHVCVGRILRCLGWSRRRMGKGAARQYHYTPPRDPGNRPDGVTLSGVLE
jgi:hypothetical protein